MGAGIIDRVKFPINIKKRQNPAFQQNLKALPGLYIIFIGNDMPLAHFHTSKHKVTRSPRPVLAITGRAKTQSHKKRNPFQSNL